MPNTVKYEPVKIGARYGRLVVLSEAVIKHYGKDKQRKQFHLCACDCGKQKEIQSASLKIGTATSCGCFHKEVVSAIFTTHGDRGSRLYRIWSHMKNRCGRKNNKQYHHYGGRGISVCAQWLHDFAAFRLWARSNGYSDDLTIERIDVNGNYEPSNCTWIPLSEQGLNRRNTVWHEAFGERKTAVDWIKDPRCIVSNALFRKRTRDGMDAEKAMTIPSRYVSGDKAFEESTGIKCHHRKSAYGTIE